MGTAFYLHDDYPNFSGPEFSPRLAATGMVEIAGAPGHVFTLTFGAPVRDPVLFLGSLGSVLALPAGTAVTRISGDQGLHVSGATVTGTAANPPVLPDGSLGLSDSNGTVAISGLFPSLTFTLTPNFGDGSGPDGVFLQLGGFPLGTPADLVDGAGALQDAAWTAWGAVSSLSRQLIERAVADAADGHLAASAVSQRAAVEVVTGAWSDPEVPAGGDAAVAAAVDNAQQVWAAAVAARTRIGADVSGARAALDRLASIGAAIPPSLADFRDPLQGPVRFCDFDTGVQPDGGPLTYGAWGGRWNRGDLRVSVDTDGAMSADGSLSDVESTIRSALDMWREESATVSATGQGYFTFHHVPKGQPAEIQATFIDPGSFNPPQPDDTDVVAAAKPPEHGIIRYNKRKTPSLERLRFDTLHEGGHMLGLGHSGVRGSLMFPFDTGSAPVIDDLARKAFAVLYGWLPRQDLLDRATNDRPSMHVVHRDPNYIPQMLWRGPLDDETIFHAEFLGGSWTPQRDAGVGTSSHSPGLTAVDNAQFGVDIGSRLLMAWKGPGDSPGLFWSRQASPDGPFLLSGGATSQRTAFGTSAAPSLATLGNRTYMTWKGAGADDRIFYATLDTPATNEQWSGQSPVPNAHTSHGPAVVAWRERVFLFWKDAGSEKLLFSIFGTDGNASWSDPTEATYPDFVTGSDPQSVRTDAAPSAVARPRDIMLVWKGAGERPLHTSFFDGLSFSGEAPIFQSGTVGGPAVATLPDPIGADGRSAGPGGTFVAWRGNEGDRTLHWTRINSI